MTDSTGKTAAAVLLLQAEPGTPTTITSICGSTLGAGQVDRAYTATLCVAEVKRPIRGTPYPTCRPGLALTPAGLLGGVPSTPGAFSFNAEVVDGSSPALSASAQLSLTILGANRPPVISSLTAVRLSSPLMAR